MAMFIRIDLTESAIAQEGVAAKLIEICPVKIFAKGKDDKSVSIIDDNLDECTLCDQCMQICADGVKVVKLYEQ